MDLKQRRETLLQGSKNPPQRMTVAIFETDRETGYKKPDRTDDVINLALAIAKAFVGGTSREYIHHGSTGGYFGQPCIIWDDRQCTFKATKETTFKIVNMSEDFLSGRELFFEKVAAYKIMIDQDTDGKIADSGFWWKPFHKLNIITPDYSYAQFGKDVRKDVPLSNYYNISKAVPWVCVSTERGEWGLMTYYNWSRDKNKRAVRKTVISGVSTDDVVDFLKLYSETL